MYRFLLSTFLLFFMVSCASKDRLAADLLTAIGKNDLQGVQKALNHGADPNYYSPLLIAAANGSAEITVALLDKKANINFRDANGNNALFQSIMSAKNPLVARSLIMRGIDLSVRNTSGKTAFQFAVDMTDTGFVGLFTTRTTTIALKDSLLNVILSYAKQEANGKVITYAYSSLDSLARLTFAKRYGIPFFRLKSNVREGAASFGTRFGKVYVKSTGYGSPSSISVEGSFVFSLECMGIEKDKIMQTSCNEDVAILKISPGGNACEVNYLILSVDKTTAWVSDIIDMCTYANSIKEAASPDNKSCSVVLDFGSISYLYSGRTLIKQTPQAPASATTIKATFQNVEIKSATFLFFKDAKGETILLTPSPDYVGPDFTDFTKYKGRDFNITFITKVEKDPDMGVMTTTRYLIKANIL